MTFSVVIPARFGSSRLPGKPLLDIAGKPMVQHVWERACLSDASDVIIATDDERIEQVVQGFGAKCCMTRPEHPSGTDRLQQVASEMAWDDNHSVVNVQGDEPLIPPELINQVAANLEANTDAGIATLCEPITELVELRNPNAVKVVMTDVGMAQYFSRAPIPYPREHFTSDNAAMPNGLWFRHIGIYAYRTGFLHRYVEWPPAPTELLEQLEQLRALYHGVGIHVAQALQSVPAGVDTQQDLDAIRILLKAQEG